MMTSMRIFAAAAIALAIPALAGAQTGPQYSAEEVLKHYGREPAAEGQDCTGGNCLPKPETGRSVCIGTAAECARKETQTAKAEGFDLLITFRFGSDELSPQARANLAEFARAMRDPSLSSATFNVDGHTDAVGSDAFNQGLSERRAKSVVDYLESLGIARERLRAEGHGESLLRDPKNPSSGINRRVEATIRAR